MLAAGLNPVLSANAGASSPAGAYGAVDSAPISANAQSRMQMRLLDKQLKNQIDINRMTLDAQKAMNKYSTDVGAAVNLQNAKLSAAASRYAANAAAGAQMYGANVGASNVASQIENQRYMAANYPTNPFGMVSAAIAKDKGSYSSLFNKLPGVVWTKGVYNKISAYKKAKDAQRQRYENSK